jgi:hypothetical protein
MSVKWLDMCIYFSRDLLLYYTSRSLIEFFVNPQIEEEEKNEKQEIPECRNISKIKYLNNRKRENRYTTPWPGTCIAMKSVGI